MLSRAKLKSVHTERSGVRGFKKKKITIAEVQEALEKKKKQKKTFLEAYYAKWGKKKINESARSVAQEEERDEVATSSGEKTRGLRQKERIATAKYDALIKAWAKRRRKAHHRTTAEANELVMSSAAKQQARKLHNQEPHYWTPQRLANYFKCSIEKMRGFLYEGKLLEECRRRGIPIDEKALEIDDLFGKIFGAVDYPGDFFDTPEEIPIRKIHNPWYYVDPGVKSATLLKFLRTRETRHYKEASRIPTQQYPKLQVFPEVLGKGIKQRETPPHKIARWLIFDSAVHYHLYDRPIVVRDHDNTWRTATWEERRFVENSRRQIKYPFHHPFEPEYDHQPDWVRIKNKAPDTFNVAFGTEDYFDDVFSSGKKLSEKTLKELKEEDGIDLGKNFEKGVRRLAKLRDEIEKQEELREQFKGRGISIDEEEEDETAIEGSSELDRINKKNEKFARAFSEYRVKYDYE